MAIVPTWRSRPPSQAKPSPACCIYKALQDRDDARQALSSTEQKLAAVVAEQPPYYRQAFNTFRGAGGCTAEQWNEWARSGAAVGKLGLRGRHLRLVSFEPSHQTCVPLGDDDAA